MTAHDDDAARDLDLGPDPIGEDVRRVAHLLLVDAAKIGEMPGAQARRRLLLEQIAQEPREAGVAAVGAGVDSRGRVGAGGVRLRHLWRAHRVLVVAAVLVVACTSLAFADTRTPVGSVIRHAARTVHIPVPNEPPARPPAASVGGAAGEPRASRGEGEGAGGARGEGAHPDVRGGSGTVRGGSGGGGAGATGAPGAGSQRPGAAIDAAGPGGGPLPGGGGSDGEGGFDPGGSGQPVEGAPRPQQPANGGGGTNPSPNPGGPQGQQPDPAGSTGGGQQPVNPPPSGGGGGTGGGGVGTGGGGVGSGGNRPPQGDGGGNVTDPNPVGGAGAGGNVANVAPAH